MQSRSKCKNLSSLLPSEVTRIEGTLKAELQDRVFACSGRGQPLNIVLTLSESVTGFIWTAEIMQRASEVVMSLQLSPDLQRTKLFQKDGRWYSGSEKFWEGPEPVLDAASISRAQRRPALLSCDSAIFREEIVPNSSVEVEIPNFRIPRSRLPEGSIHSGPLSVMRSA